MAVNTMPAPIPIHAAAGEDVSPKGSPPWINGNRSRRPRRAQMERQRNHFEKQQREAKFLEMLGSKCSSPQNQLQQKISAQHQSPNQQQIQNQNWNHRLQSQQQNHHYLPQPPLAPQVTIEVLLLKAEQADSQKEAEWVLRRLQENKGYVWSMAQDARGCRALQQLLEVVFVKDELRSALAVGLKGHVKEAIESPHANHVLQRCIELLRPTLLSFVVEEIEKYPKEPEPEPGGNTRVRQCPICTMAKHRFGCRVLERLIEHFPLAQLQNIIDAILKQANDLCKHSFGNFVLQHLLEHGDQDVRRRICDVLQQDLVSLTQDRYACGVVDKALSYGNVEDQRGLARLLVQTPGLLGWMCSTKPGAQVAAVLRAFRVLNGSELEDARRIVFEHGKEAQLLKTRHGRLIWNAAGLPGGDEVVVGDEHAWRR